MIKPVVQPNYPLNEYIQREAEKRFPLSGKESVLVGVYEEGLSAGIELGKAFAEWLRENAVSGYDGCWDYNHSDSDQIVMSKTTSELFEIFLTERNESTKV